MTKMKLGSIFLTILFLFSLKPIYSQENLKISEQRSPVPEIVNPSVNNNAPSDAIVLFAGDNLNRWTYEKGEKAGWEISDGILTVVPGSGSIKTQMMFADCQLHIECRSPAENQSKEQGQINSGIFLQERYEVQIQDPGEWQAYDIIYTAPRFNVDSSLKSPAYITVLQNGILIQNHAELKGIGNSLRKSGYEKHPFKQSLLLEDQGNPVSYRNIWIREINVTKLFNQIDQQGWYTYLDSLGKNKDPEGNFSVENNLLHIEGKYFGYICTEKSYSNYYLKVVFKWGDKKYEPRLKDKRDSGILYHFSSKEEDKVWPKSIECQVQEGDCGDYWCVGTTVDSPNKSEIGWGMKHIFRTADFENPSGEWNTIEIICNGKQSEHYVNGHLVNYATNASVSDGRVLIQSEGAEVYYKTVELIPF